MNNKIQLVGCQIHNLKFDSDKKPESVLIKLGNLLYMPLGKADIWRLEIHDTGVELWEGSDLGNIETYTLDVEGMKFDEEYKHFSQLIGVDYKDAMWTMFCYEEKENKQELYKKVKDSSRIKEW